MSRFRRLCPLAALLLAAASLAGCGGGSSSSTSGIQGNYQGTYTPTGGSPSVLNFTVNSAGTIAGQIIDSSGDSGTVTGTMVATGTSTLNIVNQFDSASVTVPFAFSGNGVTGTGSQVENSVTTAVTIDLTENPSFAGTYNGSFTTKNATIGTSGTISLTINSGDGITGSFTPVGVVTSTPVTGTVSSTGVISLSYTYAGVTYTANGDLGSTLPGGSSFLCLLDDYTSSNNNSQVDFTSVTLTN